MTLPEELFHFIWKYRLYHKTDLYTVSGKPIVVLAAGESNANAGADFLAARIKIEDTLWVGDVEIHVHTSDWIAHRHHQDKVYNTVILHVVYEHDKAIHRQDGTFPETLELKPLIPPHIFPNYKALMNGMHWIPCERRIRNVEPFQLSQWLSRLLIERFELRVSAIFDLLVQRKGDWEETCYIWMARSFGFKVNADAFEQLTHSLPHVIVARYKHRPLAVEALFFGQAGLLDDVAFQDEYPRSLQREYRYLRKLHNLVPMDASAWKFMRTRPGNFPTIRIAQFAALCLRSSHLFAIVTANQHVNELRILFSKLSVNSYWREHRRFDAVTPMRRCQLGVNSIDVLLINAVAGILFAYGKYMDKEMYIYRAMRVLEGLKAEENTILKHFSTLGIHVRKATESQALLQMKAFYCDRKKCLDCGIGLQLIKQNGQ